MKKLLPLILVCALLCGCGRSAPSEEAAPVLPTESVAGELSEPEEYGGSIQMIPLNLRKVRGLRIFGGNILLFSGYGSTTLTLMDAETRITLATASLPFQLEPDDPSLVLHPEGALSFFDPEAGETVILDSNLTECSRISVPGKLSGNPILSPDRKTLFYCTASQVRAWDLESGIHRCIKEMSLESQRLAGVHMGGTVLQCQVVAGEQIQTLFLRSSDGSLLHQGDGVFSLSAEDGRYFAHIPAGTYRIPVFGDVNGSPQMLTPTNLSGKTVFLPAHNAAVTTSVQDGQQTCLEYCRLSDGALTSTIFPDAYHSPKSVDCLDGDTLVLLTYDPETDQDLLTLWEIPSSLPNRESDCISPYHTADAPDLPGLSQCRRQAALLEQRYGIRILLWDAVQDANSPEWEITPEHLVPILQRELALLEQRLGQYPQSLLQQTAAHFSGVNLCLVRSLSSNSDHTDPAPGAQFLVGSEAYVLIPTGTEADQALHHQLFHLMETHIFAGSNAFDQWDTLNPAGFRYDYDYAANASRDSGVYLFAENRAFVDTFSMSYPKEDRARILEYAMLPDQESLFRPRAMQKKLRTLCDGIRDAYDLENHGGIFPWEQYLE